LEERFERAWHRHADCIEYSMTSRPARRTSPGKTSDRGSYGAVGKALGMMAAASLVPPAMAAKPPIDEGELIVTAQLRDQPRTDVPISLNVLSADDIARYHLDTLEDAGSLVPGLQVQAQSPNDPGFGIRGITSDSGASFDEARVSILENGVSISRSRGVRRAAAGRSRQ